MSPVLSRHVTAKKQQLDKAQVLIEALPWLEKYSGTIMVIKYGGNAMINEELKKAFVEDIAFLHHVGVLPVVVHGGGPQITEMLGRLDIDSEFKAGLRVTSHAAMEVVRMVLVGKVGRELVNLLNEHGPLAVGLSGEDANLFTAEPRHVYVEGEEVDLGQVGDVTGVRPDAVQNLLKAGCVPIVATVAPDEHGEVYNVNADPAASALAAALGARRLIMLTDVPGLYADWPNSQDVIAKLTPDEVEEMLPSLASGMRPKMEACMRAVRGGVEQATIIDGRDPHSLLLEMVTDDGLGTAVME